MSVISVEKDFDSLSLILVADFEAPVERVWQLWADPRQLERWWGPPNYPATVEQHDLVAGGEVSYFMSVWGALTRFRRLFSRVGRPVGCRNRVLHAARLYSWISPPSRSRRSTWSGRGELAGRSVGGGSGGSRLSERCGR